MLHKEEITSLMINALFVKILIFYPRIAVLNSENAAWMQILFNLLVMLLIYLITVKVYKTKKNVIQIASEKGGKWLKILVGTVVFLILMINLLSIIRIFPETVRIVLLKETPTNIIMLIFAIASAFGAYMGINSIARIHYKFLPIAGAVLFIFLIMLIPYYSIDNIMPILGGGADKIFIKGMRTMSFFADILLLNILIPYAPTLNDLKKSGLKSIIVSGSLAFITVLAYCLAYPNPISKEFVFPVYQLARMVHLTSFFSRFEAFFQFVWSLLVMLYSSLYVCILSLVWQQTFSLKFNKPLILPVTAIAFSLAMIPTSVVNTINIDKTISAIIYPLVFIIPIVFGLLTRKQKKL